MQSTIPNDDYLSLSACFVFHIGFMASLRANPFSLSFRQTVFLILLYLFRLNILLFEKDTVPLPEINVEK
jgi:hypothetical protein